MKVLQKVDSTLPSPHERGYGCIGEVPRAIVVSAKGVSPRPFGSQTTRYGELGRSTVKRSQKGSRWVLEAAKG